MNIKQEQRDGFLLIRIDGELDAHTSGELEDVAMNAIENTDKNLLFDLAALSYMSSAGLRSFPLITKKIKALNKKFALFGLSENIKEVFDISGFSSIISIFHSEEEAVNSIHS